ncbi:MAG: glycerophosphodiester phosphodiesterase family protein [Lentisphaeria bacterium]|nr:glycerophosphodiester phosphodiesterase family protein [Lentisphaeria bacterium]
MSFSSVRAMLDREIAEHRILIAVHRGCSGGTIVENTVNGLETAWKMGADMAEADVFSSTDGVFCITHDNMERHLFFTERNVKEMSSAEVDALEFRNNVTQPCGHVETLDYALKKLRGGKLVNIDRAWRWWERFLAELPKYDMAEQLLLKSPPKEEYLAALERSPVPFMYMPIVKTMEQFEMLRSWRGRINIVGYELIFDELTHPLVAPETMREIADSGAFAWVNTISKGAKYRISGGREDTPAVLEDPDRNWGVHARMGFRVFQTDWPVLLREYLEAAGFRPPRRSSPIAG